MARIRSIKPEFFDHEELCTLSPFHRLCFIALWCHADRAGRLEDRPRRLKARMFPYDDVDMEGLLMDLAEAGFIVRYAVDGVRYLAIPTWEAHQRPRQDEHPSVIPARPGHATGTAIVTDPSLRSDGPDAHKRIGNRKVGGRKEGAERVRAPYARAGENTPIQPSHGQPVPDEVSLRAGRFCERYAELHAKYRNGAKLVRSPAYRSPLGAGNLEFLEAVALCETWDDARLDQLAEAFLVTDDEWVASGPRTMARFRSRASWCDDRLREAGL